MMSIFQLKESAHVGSHQGITNLADSIPNASYQHCPCLFSDPSRSHPQEECTLASALHTSSEKATQIRKYQFALLKRQWSSKGRVDGRSERLLDGVITDVRNGVYPALGNYLDLYTMFQSELLGSGSNGRIFRARRRTDGILVRGRSFHHT